jgi:hypothetical protein
MTIPVRGLLLAGAVWNHSPHWLGEHVVPNVFEYLGVFGGHNGNVSFERFCFPPEYPQRLVYGSESVAGPRHTLPPKVVT